MLQSVFIQNVRNIHEAEFECVDGFNWFVGENGAGKTSLLEALSLLLSTKSFRTHKPKVYIASNKSDAIIRGELNEEGHRSSATYSIAMLKSRSGETIYRSNKASISSSELLCLTPPLQVIAPELANIVDTNSQDRRKFLDWGVFHVKHDFLGIWRRFHRALKQRNSALKERSVDKLLIDSIDQQWVALAKEVHNYRENYWQSFVTYISGDPIDMLKKILNGNNGLGETFEQVDFRYRQGWSSEKTLEEAIEGSFESDCKMGFTQLGPQKSDFQILFDRTPAIDILSRGQKKLLQVWLKLTQSAHLYAQAGKKCIFLVDDISAELDSKRVDWVYAQMKQFSHQVFGTATRIDDHLDAYISSEKAMFHVKHGQISQFSGDFHS